MINTDERPDSLLNSLEPVVNGLGFELVNLTHAKVRQTLQVQCIIYSPSGITLDDCTKVHRALLPRIELIEDSRDVSIQVSSPGTTRKIKKIREFRVFCGRNIKLYLEDDWFGAVIIKVDDSGVNFKINDEERYILFSEIVKAKLE